MNPLRRLAFSAYYYANAARRKSIVNKLSQEGNVPLSVLFYHRVADTHPNGWTISRDGFAKQIRWLQENVELISLPEVQRRMVAGQSPRPAVSITFDDGYAENCDYALPMLVEAGIPVTYFVTLNNVKSGCPFPHDEAEGQPLAPNDVEQLRAFASLGVEIGAHTATHPDLGKIRDENELRDEIVNATLELGELVEQPVRYFAFPYGQAPNLNPEVARLAALEANIQGICSAYGAYNLPGNNAFHVRRIHGDPEFTRWRNWVSIDPRKIHENQDIGRSLQLRGRDILSPKAAPKRTGVSV